MAVKTYKAQKLWRAVEEFSRSATQPKSVGAFRRGLGLYGRNLRNIGGDVRRIEQLDSALEFLPARLRMTSVLADGVVASLRQRKLFPTPRESRFQFEHAFFAGQTSACNLGAASLITGWEHSVVEWFDVTERFDVPGTHPIHRFFNGAKFLSSPRPGAVFVNEVHVKGLRLGLEIAKGVVGTVESWVQQQVGRSVDARQHWSEYLNVMHGMAEALAHIHEADIIHRAVRPSHAYITEDGVKFGGFDQAIWKHEAVNHGRRAQSFLFDAPELALGATPSVQSDVYSMGISYYAMLDKMTMLWKVPWESASSMRPDLPISPAFDELLLSMVHHFPDCRPQSAAEVAKRLQGMIRQNESNV